MTQPSRIQSPVKVPSHWEMVSVTGVLLVWVFLLVSHLGVGLITGLAVFALTRWVRNRMEGRMNPLVVTVLTSLSVALAAFMLLFCMTILFKASMSLAIEQGPKLLEQVVENVNQVALHLPPSVQDKLPNTVDELMDVLKDVLDKNASRVTSIGGAGVFITLQLLFATILGTSAALQPVHKAERPLALAWRQGMADFCHCFALLMGAQVYVSVWNTFCTAVFVYLVLPAFHIELPFREALCLFTAVASLVPAAGNVAANSLLTVMTLKFGMFVTIGSVVFMIVVHKAEYFVNGWFIGKRVKASVPEMLIAIILGEALFGITGLITAPVMYAFLKTYARRWEWI